MTFKVTFTANRKPITGFRNSDPSLPRLPDGWRRVRDNRQIEASDNRFERQIEAKNTNEATAKLVSEATDYDCRDFEFELVDADLTPGGKVK